MKTGGWRWQSTTAVIALVAVQWAAMPAFAQTISVLAAVPAGAAQVASIDAAPALESSSAGSRWHRFESISGIVSYTDRQPVKPQPDAAADANSYTVYFRLPRNVLSDFMIKIADGQPIRSSVKQVVLNCARHSYTVVAQTLYRARNVTGKPLYQIHYGDEAQSHSLCEGSMSEWIVGCFCGAGH